MIRLNISDEKRDMASKVSEIKYKLYARDHGAPYDRERYKGYTLSEEDKRLLDAFHSARSPSAWIKS